MMKRCSVFVVFATLLAAFALVMACSGVGSEPSDYQIPPGKGVIQLKFNSNIQRTILPVDYKAEDFAIFGVQFEATDDDDDAVTVPLALYTLAQLVSNPIPLIPGAYDLTVIGYMKYVAPNASEEAATATVEITIEPGKNTYTTITLSAIDPVGAAEEGEFEWIITNEVTYLSEASMKVTAIGGDLAYSKTWDSLPDIAKDAKWTGKEPLTEGYYYVDFKLEASDEDGGDLIIRNFRHVLHIYRYITSKFEYKFDDEKLGISAIDRFVFNSTPIEFEIKDLIPILSQSDPVTLSLAAEQQATITVSNAGTIGYASYEWWCGTDDDFIELTDEASGASLLIDLEYPFVPFDTVGEYTLTVIGFKDDAPYSSESIYIIIVP
jgi:hypothetical protein